MLLAHLKILIYRRLQPCGAYMIRLSIDKAINVRYLVESMTSRGKT